jgi:hypothetical protein
MYHILIFLAVYSPIPNMETCKLFFNSFGRSQLRRKQDCRKHILFLSWARGKILFVAVRNVMLASVFRITTLTSTTKM